MALEVIGSGFGRSGTKSLKAALEQLGFGPYHHMHEVFENPPQCALAGGRPRRRRRTPSRRPQAAVPTGQLTPVPPSPQ